MGGTTATTKNAMTRREIDGFLAERHVGSLATLRADNYCHVTPIYFLWEQGRIYFHLAERRRHLRNLRRIPKATLCVEEDLRPQLGWEAGARAVMLAGPVELSDDPEELSPVFSKIAVKYLGPGADDLSRYPEEVAEKRTLIIMTAEVLLSWDFRKG